MIAAGIRVCSRPGCRVGAAAVASGALTPVQEVIVMSFAHRFACRTSATLVAGLLSLAFAAAASAQAPTRLFKAGSGPDELWDVTMKMEMPGMPMAMPAQTQQVCLKKNRKAEDAIPANDECRLVDSKTVGNKTTFTMDCAGKDPMTVRGEITSTPTAYDGTMRMKGKRKGEDMEITQVFSGRKVGACTDQSEQVVAKVKADSDAALAKSCSEGLDKLYAPMFFGNGAACAGQQKQFCEKVRGLSSGMREPAGHRAAVGKSNAATVREAFVACGQDFDAATRSACGKAVSTRDWSFVGSGTCDADVRSVGDAQCKGRSYYTMDRSLAPVCNRYAALTRGGAGAASMSGAPSAAAEPVANAPQAPAEQKADPVRQGMDALRKVLPF